MLHEVRHKKIDFGVTQRDIPTYADSEAEAQHEYPPSLL